MKCTALEPVMGAVLRLDGCIDRMAHWRSRLHRKALCVYHGVSKSDDGSNERTKSLAASYSQLTVVTFLLQGIGDIYINPPPKYMCFIYSLPFHFPVMFKQASSIAAKNQVALGRICHSYEYSTYHCPKNLRATSFVVGAAGVAGLLAFVGRKHH